MNIAIASSGLGHVARGIETWACDTAVALSQLSSCQVDELPASGKSPTGTVVGCQVAELSGKSPAGQPLTTQQPNNLATNLTVTLFAGAPLSHPVNCHVEVLPCLRRSNPKAQQLSNCFPSFTWRWGLKSTYGWEQFSFWWRLWPQLRRGKFDILHVQDPMLAYWCRVFRKWGLVKTKEILAHGTEEPVEFLAKFDYVQHLAPWHLEQTLKKLKEKRGFNH